MTTLIARARLLAIAATCCLVFVACGQTAPSSPPAGPASATAPTTPGASPTAGPSGPAATETASASAPAPTGPPPTPAAARYDHPEDVGVGQCFDPIDDKDDGVLLAVIVRSCTEPHGLELFGRPELNFDADAEWPGDEIVDPSSEDACDALFLEYVGVAYQDSSWSYSFIRPSEATWATGDRAIMCLIEAPEGETLSRSARGTAE
jgi:hypothetical protein